MRLRLSIAASILLCTLPTSLFAQTEVIIYRCTDANGNVSLQNDRPCPAGHKQDIRMIGTLPTAPSTVPPIPRPTRPAAPVAVAQPQPSPQVVVPAPQPPPALFQCRSWDDRDYYGDTGDPPASCAPLQTIGIDGRPYSNASASACEMRRDTCTAVEANQLCIAWKRRLDEAEFRWRYAGSRNDDRKTEFERIAKVYNDSTCGR